MAPSTIAIAEAARTIRLPVSPKPVFGAPGIMGPPVTGALSEISTLPDVGPVFPFEVVAVVGVTVVEEPETVAGIALGFTLTSTVPPDGAELEMSQVKTTEVEFPAETTSGLSNVITFEPEITVGMLFPLLSAVPRLPNGRTRQSLTEPAVAPPANERLIGSDESCTDEFEFDALNEITAIGASCAPGRTTGVVPRAMLSAAPVGFEVEPESVGVPAVN